MIQGSSTGFMQGLGQFFDYLTRRRDQRRDLEAQQKYRQAILDDERNYQQALKESAWEREKAYQDKTRQENQDFQMVLKNKEWQHEKERMANKAIEDEKERAWKEKQERNNLILRNELLQKAQKALSDKPTEKMIQDALDYGESEGLKTAFNPALLNVLMSPTLPVKDHDATQNMYGPDYNQIANAILPQYQGNIGQFAASPYQKALRAGAIAEAQMPLSKREEMREKTELNVAKKNNYNAKTEKINADIYREFMGTSPKSDKDYKIQNMSIQNIDKFINYCEKKQKILSKQNKNLRDSPYTEKFQETIRQNNEYIEHYNRLIKNAISSRTEMVNKTAKENDVPAFDIRTGELIYNYNESQEDQEQPTVELSSPNGGQRPSKEETKKISQKKYSETNAANLLRQ